jgi:hypothetical protein
MQQPLQQGAVGGGAHRDLRQLLIGGFGVGLLALERLGFGGGQSRKLMETRLERHPLGIATAHSSV